MQGYRPRIEERTKVMVRAKLRSGHSESDACVLDISTRGLAASSAVAPQRGEFVELAIGDNILIGQVRWSSGRRFGVAFRDRVSVIGVLSGEGSATLKRGREAACTVALRRADTVEARAESGRLEFVIFAAAAAISTLFVADYASSSLSSLDTVKLALNGSVVTGQAPSPR